MAPTDRLTSYLLAALDHDLGEFLNGLSDREKERVGVALGSAYGHLSSYLAYFETGTEQGYQLVNPRHFPHTLPNCSAVSVNDAYSLWGSSTPVGTGLSAGMEALAYAAGAIRGCEEDAMIAGGYDEINPCNVHVLESVATVSPSGICRPLASDRDGTVPGEGIGVLLLQSAEAAAASHRNPLAQYGATVIRRGMWWDAPDVGAKAVEVVREAVGTSGLELTDITAVFPSANGCPRGDDFEAQLLWELFGKRLPPIDVVPIKAITGECLAASGPLQCLAAVGYLAGAAHGTSPHEAPAAALAYTTGYDGTFAATVFHRSGV